MANYSPGNRVVHGARAKIIIGTEVVGIFTAFSYGLAYHAEPVYIIGNPAPIEINYLSQEVVQCQGSGWRVVGAGPHESMKLPRLQELLNQNDIQIKVLDRQTGKVIATIHNVKPVSYQTAITARQQEEISVSFVGLLVTDENDPSASATVDTNAVNPVQMPPISS